MQVDGLPTALTRHAHSRCTAATPTSNYHALRLIPRVAGSRGAAINQ